ncbi:hypothetical protein BH11ACT8_BH11ACT8_28400 [soil metagenome]
MNRILLWAMSTITVLVLLFGYRTSLSGPDDSMAAGSVPAFSGSAAQGSTGSSTSGSSSGGAASPPDDQATSDPAAPEATAPETTAPETAAPETTAPATKTVTGPSTPTEWGPVQVQVTVDGSTITDVSVVQYPSGNGRDQEINSYALPILIQETLDQQSAQIDMISGATVTSRGYLTSLQAALDEAMA